MKFFHSRVVVAIIFFLFGVIFFLVKKEIIVVRFNLFEPKNILVDDEAIQKKINFYFSDGTRDYDCSQNVLWHRSKQSENLKVLTQMWLDLACSEQFIYSPINIQNIFLSSNKSEIYVSFDSNPFGVGWSIRKKIYFIESFLKTVARSVKSLSHIIFLVNHEQLQDDHLDFSYPWPLDGFINNSLVE